MEALKPLKDREFFKKESLRNKKQHSFLPRDMQKEDKEAQKKKSAITCVKYGSYFC